MRPFGLSVLALIVSCLMPAFTEAGPLTYSHGGEPLFSLVFPDSWIVDTDFVEEAEAAGNYKGGEPEIRLVEAMPGDGSKLWFGIWIAPRVSTLEEGLEYIASLDGELFTDVESSEPQKASLRDMAARTFYGTARREGEEVEYAVALFEPRESLIAVALYVGRPRTWKKHRAQLTAILDSLRPSGG